MQQAALYLRPSEVRQALVVIGRPGAASVVALRHAQEVVDAWQSVLRIFTAGDQSFVDYEPPENEARSLMCFKG